MDFLKQVPIEIIFLWSFRIGLALLIVGLCMPSKNRKSILSKILYKKNSINNFYPQGKLVEFLDKMTENEIFRGFRLKENSDEYQRLEGLIVQAGGVGGITPNVIQLFRIVMPPTFFICALFGYIVKIHTQFTSLNQNQLEQIVDKSASMNRFMQPMVVANAPTTPSISFTTIWVIFIIALVLYLVPELIVKQVINKRQIEMKKELPIIETFVSIMLEAETHTVYEILRTLYDTTTLFKPYLAMCLNEYYVNPQQAIQNMANRVQNEEFQVVCNGLKQAVDVDKKCTAIFLKQDIEQLKKLQGLEREASIKKKPLVYVLLLAIPLGNIVVLWFYPWFAKAMKLLTTGF